VATYVKFQPFVENLAEKVHDLGSDQLVVALTNTAPNATDATLSQITEITYTNCSSRNITTSTSAQTSGTYKLVVADLVLTASGGTVGPFRYVVIYNDTPSSPADPLICYYDYGSSITLAAGETLTIDFDGTNGLLQLA
jgi:hypothetical protein